MLERKTRQNGLGVPLFGNSRAAALLLLLTFGCFAMIIFRTVWLEERKFWFLLWNLYLAWLPFIVSIAAIGAGRLLSNRTLRVSIITLLGVLWLLLFPNAPYLTTDFIHLISNRPNYVAEGQFLYLVWYDLILFLLFSWCGLLLGFLSTYQFHRLAAKRFGQQAGWLFVLAVSLLGGYGIFLGRIVRLNSWDVLRPDALLANVLGHLHTRGLLFTLLFGFMLLFFYVSLYVLQESKKRAD